MKAFHLKRLRTVLATSVGALVVIGSLLFPLTAHATFNPNLLMDDDVFDNSGSMSASQIDSFLNGFANSCISQKNGFSSPDPIGYSPSTGFKYGGNVSAGNVIAHAAQAYDLNPQVLLATLQKEQSLVSGSAGCHPNTPNPSAPYSSTPGPNNTFTCNINGESVTCTYACTYSGGCMNIAIGNDCPGYCKASSEGFSKQVLVGAWKLKYWEQRSKGNVNWDIQKPGWDNSDDPPSCYEGAMTQGNRARSTSSATCAGAPGNQVFYYDGNTLVNNGSTSVHLDTGATAALYRFTPFTSGNQSFVNIFEGWFGGTVSSAYYSCHNATNIAGALGGWTVRPANLTGNADSLSVLMPNNTGSACAEVHTWSNSSYQDWSLHQATNLPAFNPANAELLYAHPDGGKDTLYLVQYRGTGSGKVEIHGWDSTYLHWSSHIATNLPAIDPANARVVAADFNRDGKDEFYLIKYRNTGSGNVEIHGWSQDLQSWDSHVATNLPAIDPANDKIVASDINGDGRDEFTLVKYRNTGSGKVEVHTFNHELTGWDSHIATNLPVIDPADDEIITVDSNGDGRDEFTLVKYRNTGSGKVEVHGWSQDLQSWDSHVATNMGTFNP